MLPALLSFSFDLNRSYFYLFARVILCFVSKKLKEINEDIILKFKLADVHGFVKHFIRLLILYFPFVLVISYL